MNKLEEQRKFPVLLLSEIHRLIKIEDLTLLKQSGNHMTIKGLAMSDPVVADFMKRLEDSTLYKDVELVSRVRQVKNTEAADFHITATLDSYPDASLEVIPKELLPTFLPEMKDIPSLPRQITGFGVEAGLEIRHILLKKGIPKDGYFEIPFDMEVTGEYENIVTFFDALRRMDRFVTLRAIEMHSVEDGSTIMKTSMTVVTYRQ
jgi:Tfp pilus assembly protein PilO